MNGYASGVERRWGAAIMSSFHAAWSAGGLVGAALGGALLVFGAPWTLGVAAALVVALAALVWTWLQEGDVLPLTEPHIAPPVGALLPLCVAALLCMACEGAMGDWVGVYLMETAHTPQVIAPVGFAAFSATMVVGPFSATTRCTPGAARASCVGVPRSPPSASRWRSSIRASPRRRWASLWSAPACRTSSRPFSARRQDGRPCQRRASRWSRPPATPGC
jgi:hypothetical protein